MKSKDLVLAPGLVLEAAVLVVLGDHGGGASPIMRRAVFCQSVR